MLLSNIRADIGFLKNFFHFIYVLFWKTWRTRLSVFNDYTNVAADKGIQKCGPGNPKRGNSEISLNVMHVKTDSYFDIDMI